MSSIRIICPHCAVALRAGAQVFGRRIKCRKCGQGFVAAANGGEFPPGSKGPVPVGNNTGGRSALILALAAGLVLLLGGGAFGVYLMLNQDRATEQAKADPQDQQPGDSGKNLDSLPPNAGGTGAANKNSSPAVPTTPVAGGKDDSTGSKPKGGEEPKPSQPLPEPKKSETPPPAGTDTKPVDPPGGGPSTTPKKTSKTHIEKYHSILSDEKQKKVEQAIAKGVAFFRKNQLPSGNWCDEVYAFDLDRKFGVYAFTAFPALALLECGVPPDDPMIQKAAKIVRQDVINDEDANDLSLAILFFDKLGDKQDEKLIRKLAVRLIAAQQGNGGWGWRCARLNDKDEVDLLAYLEKTRPDPYMVGDNGELLFPITKEYLDKEMFIIPGGKKESPGPMPECGNQPGGPEGNVKGQVPGVAEPIFKPFDTTKLSPALQKLPIVQTIPTRKALRRKTPLKNVASDADNFKTHYAAMALWVARKYKVPVEKTLALVDQRFLSSQMPDGGWAFYYTGGHKGGGSISSTHTSTSIGLIALAIGHGSYRESLGAAWKLSGLKDIKQEPAFQNGLTRLGKYLLEVPSVMKPAHPFDWNLHFHWSMEKLAMLHNLKTIGGKEWYPWAADQLVACQTQYGTWRLTIGTAPESVWIGDTSKALLILKRANFLADLTESL